MKLIAHRGASQLAPENTLAALKKAAEMGATWVECDAQLTKDERVIVFHDDTLDRSTNGSGAIADTYYSDIQTLDAGSWFSKNYQHEKIPLFEDFLKMAHHLSVRLVVELKTTNKADVLAKKILELLTPYPQEHFLLSSFSQDCLAAIRKYDSDIPLAYIISEWPSDWKTMTKKYQCEGLHVDQEIVTQDRIREIKSHDLKVRSFTINSSEKAQELFSFGVDAIFSDNPQLLTITHSH